MGKHVMTKKIPPDIMFLGEPFEKYMKKQFAILGLNNTYLDKAEPIIYNRAKYYVRDKHHRLQNAPYVDNRSELTMRFLKSFIINKRKN